jgi:predicted RNase H-like nuclease
MTITIIGVDCAVQAQNVGLAKGSYTNGHISIEQALIAAKERPPIETILEWIPAASATLIALDAPLGWPASLGEALHVHRAGDLIAPVPNQLFRRATDRFIKQVVGKQPLDVGADRIARTAHAALHLLADIQARTGRSISLAWEPGITKGIFAVEVYPAATLIAHGIHSAGYKRKGSQDVREELVRHLGRRLDLPADTSLLAEQDDALDAVICVLAGADFLSGQVYYPPDIHQARKEGWIWVKTKE